MKLPDLPEITINDDDNMLIHIRGYGTYDGKGNELIYRMAIKLLDANDLIKESINEFNRLIREKYIGTEVNDPTAGSMKRKLIDWAGNEEEDKSSDIPDVPNYIISAPSTAGELAKQVEMLTIAVQAIKIQLDKKEKI